MCTRVYIYMSIYACRYTPYGMHVAIHHIHRRRMWCALTCTHTCIFIYICIHIYTCVNVYTYTYVFIYVYMRKYT